ncbi:MAG: PAS domain-containing sensor histidine kinase [Peptostreptococcaceae bacterium]
MKEQIYKQLIEVSPVAYAHLNVVWNDDGTCKSAKLIDINKSFEKNFGTKKERAIGLDIKKYLIDESGFDLISVLKNTVNGENVTTKYSYEKNEKINIEVYNFDPNEYHLRLTKVSSNGIMSSTLRQSPFIAWIKDRNGKYIDVNDNYIELLNTKYEDIIGKYDNELWNAKTSSEFKNTDDIVIRENKLQIYDEIIDIGDSKKRYFETAKWPYTNEDGSIILGSMGISMEATDKRKLKEVIERNEQNFLDLANNIDQLIIIEDKKRALYISPYFEELYGFKPDELYEDMDKWYKYWDKIEFIERRVQDHKYKEVYNSIFRVVKEGKIDKWIHCKTAPILDENGKILRSVSILSDITNKKNLEEELESLRSEFFTNLSHELRTPINLITSTLQVISPRVDKLDKDNKEYINKYLDILNQNALRLLKLVNNLIDSTKIDSGNFVYSPKNQDVVSFVENICTSVVEFVERNNLEIIFDTDTEEKIVGFDLDHMERIILNLISNAIKFNKENGKIEITISTKDNIVISVKDEGIGIPRDKLDSVFGRFEQVNEKMKKEREGSGIGLSLVKSLVEMHNGNIKLNSKLGEGSEFLITLPDVLVNEDNNVDFEKIPPYLSKINKLEVEFSDIYT